MNVRPCNLLNAILRNKYYRVLFGLIFGFLLGIGLYELVLEDLEFDNNESVWLCLSVCLILAIGNACSIQILCISFLTLPSICGRAGRSALKALVITFILAGPVKNLTINAWEVVKLFTCTTELTYNLTKTRFELMHEPFQEAILNMKEDVTDLKDTTKSVNNLVGVISNELEEKNEAEEYLEYNDYLEEVQENFKRSVEIEEKNKTKENETNAEGYEKGYLHKLDNRCEKIISNGTKRCHEIFKDAYDRCYDKVSVLAAWLLCWPMKLTFVCRIKQAMGGGAGVCDAAKEIEPGFGRSYAYIKETGKMFKGKGENFEDIKIKYKPIEFTPPLNISDVKDMTEYLQEDFKYKKSIFDTISIIIRRLLSIIFLKVLLEAQKYHEKYLDDLNHDNYWVTSYFCHIDIRRQTLGKKILLPLKKAEKANLSYPTALLPRSHEIRGIVLKFAMTLLETITATVLILLDKLLYEILLIVQKHSRIDYSQTGKYGLIVEVKGTGMMAKLVNSLLYGFNSKQDVHNKRSNYECLPDSTEMNQIYLYKIYGTYLIISILIFLESYTKRLKRIICATFYRKREKQRILFLYNQYLKKRAKFLKNTAANAKDRYKENKRTLSAKMNILLCLRYQYPKYFGWLRKITTIAQLRCLICRQREGGSGLYISKEPSKEGKRWFIKSGTEKWQMCEKPECNALYCAECWKDIENICCVCSVVDSSDVSDKEDNE